MINIFIAIFVIIISSSFAIANEESEEIIVYIKQKSIVPVKNPKKIVLVTDNIVEAQKQDEYISLEGKSYGETMMYIWEQNDNIRIFKVKTVFQKSIERLSKNSYQINKDINYNFSYGFNSFSFFSDKTNSQNLGSFVNYFYKINDNERINFRTNINSNIIDLNNFKDFSLQNINLEYKSKNWLVSLGDNGSISNTNLLNFNNVFVRGFRLSNKFDNNEFEFSSGFEYRPILFTVSRIENKILDKYINNIYDRYNFSKDSFVEGKFISSVDTKKNYTLSNNLTLSALNKTEQYSIAGAIDTNFSSLNTAFNYSYIKKWDSKEEWIEPSLFFSSINDFKNNLKNDIYGFNLRGLHISKINMFSGFQINDNGIEKLLNINYGLNRSFFDNTFLASFSTNFIYSDTRKNYLNRLIFNYNKNIPVRILFLNTLTDSYTSNELSGQIDWLSNNSFKFHTNISIRKFFSNISDIFSYSIGLNFAYHVNENLSLSYNPSYYFDNRNNLANYILNNNITSNINLNSHIFNLTLLSQNNLSTNENNLYSFNLSYIYNFFGQVDKPKGEINAFLFEDINNNNILDKEENILKDSSIYINNKKYQSDREGKIKVSNLDYESYNLFIDNSDLPKGYYPTSNKLKIIDLKEKLINVSFGISKKTKLKILSYTNKYKPLENIKIYFDNQTYLSDINGEILVDTTIGNHKIEIDNNSIPKGFFMITSIDENIDVKDNKTEIFLSFQPLISIKGIIKPQKEINLSIDYIKDEIITDEKQVKTQKDGRFYILNIDADKIIIKLNDKNLKEIEIPEVSQVIDLRLDID